MKNIRCRRAQFIVIAILALFISGCPVKQDEIYPVAEEEYLMGWVLHNINKSTPTELGYSEEELEKYVYYFNYPGSAPGYYGNTLFWIGPYQLNAFTSIVQMGAPLKRVYYVKGDASPEGVFSGQKWHLINDMNIAYGSLDYSTSFQEQLPIMSFPPEEPTEGGYEQIYFGTSPYTPASVIVEENHIKLNNHLLRGYNGRSYLWRRYVPETSSLPHPQYKIYLEGEEVDKGRLTGEGEVYYWDYNALNYGLSDKYDRTKTGNYEVVLTIPSGYPLFSTTDIYASFMKDGSNEIELPVLQHIEFPPRFEINQELEVEVEFENPGAIKEVSMYYRTNQMKEWVPFGKKGKGTLVVKDLDAKSIDFKFTAVTKDGKTAYEIQPISLKSEKIDVKFIMPFERTKDGTVIIKGICHDSERNGINNLRLELYSPDYKYLGAVMTDDVGNFSLETEVIVESANAVFKGTGVYAPQPPNQCKDSDRGENYHEKGTTIGYDSYGGDINSIAAYTDKCDGEARVMEFYCEVQNDPHEGAGYVSMANHPCEGRCKDGACVRGDGGG